jgi:outer membrane receptor protein involved in Fe transport
MANAGKTRSRGVELSASWQLPLGFGMRASYGLTDAKFTDFTNGKTNYAGNYVPYAPLNTIFVGGVYSKQLHNSFIDHIHADINLRGVGKIYWNEANTVTEPLYMLLDASVRADHGDLSAELWANNITGKQYSTFYFVSIGNAFLQRGNGFSIGVTLRYALAFH